MQKNNLTGLLFSLLLATSALTGQEFVPGRIVVGYDSNIDATVLARTLRNHSAIAKRHITPLSAHVLEIPEQNSQAIIASLKSTGLFKYVERDYYAHTAGTAVTPNDPSYASQWHLSQIQAPQAWTITTGSSAIVVAVIDSGVDSTHPDLASKIIPGWNFVANSADTTDVLGHGTAVAGTVAAASNNGVGVTGVSWQSMVMPLVVVDSNDYASYSNMASAIQYAADHGAQVINLSLGGSSASSVLQSAVDYAWSKGAIIFASAMNNSTSTPYYPAACTHVVSVSATDSGDNLASFSDYGNSITLAAPGTGILTTTAGGGYGYWAGTSFSSPIAAGVAALVLAVTPSMTNSSLVSLLEQNTDDLGTAGYDNYFGWGRINAAKAVAAANGGLAGVSIAPSTITLSAGQTQQFTPSLTGIAAASTVTWSVAPAVGVISANGLYTAPAIITAAQNVTVTATAGSATCTATISLVAPKMSLTPASVTLNAGQSQQFAATVTGASAAAVTWSLSPGIGSVSTAGVYTAPTVLSSNQIVTVTASVAGVSSSAAITLVAPKISVTPTSVTLSAGQTQQFAATVTGASAAAVTWSLSPAVGSISTTGVYTAPAAIASAQTVAVTAAVAGVSSSAAVTLQPTTGGATTAAIRVNAGGTSYVDTLSQKWSSDSGYTGGNVSSTANTVKNTTAQGLYQSCRWGTFSYGFTVPNGSYTVTLKFAEISRSAAGQRQFNVTINGAQVLSNFDIVAAAGGPLTAIDKTFSVNVTGGRITVAFAAGAANQPMVNGIEIVAGASALTQPITAPSFTPLYTNAGGSSYTDVNGITWGGDSHYTSGSAYQTGSSIAGTVTPAIYQSCRWGAFSYTYNVPNGTYAVTLKFAEPSMFGVGKRAFNVAINGSPVLTNFDIYAQAGALTALDKTFSVNVTGGSITIVFAVGAADWPLVNAIQIAQPTNTLGSLSTAVSNVVRMNAGSEIPYTDTTGITWTPDSSFNGGYTFLGGSTISGTTAPGVYQSCRWGTFSYQFNLQNGSYIVTLKFAEVSKFAVGARMFNVAINDSAVLSNFDIFEAAGGGLIAVDRSFPVTVTNGQLKIAFTAGAADLPLVNGIQIDSGTSSIIGTLGAVPSTAIVRRHL